jgi:hypothetical protein
MRLHPEDDQEASNEARIARCGGVFDIICKASKCSYRLSDTIRYYTSPNSVRRFINYSYAHQMVQTGVTEVVSRLQTSGGSRRIQYCIQEFAVFFSIIRESHQ